MKAYDGEVRYFVLREWLQIGMQPREIAAQAYIEPDRNKYKVSICSVNWAFHNAGTLSLAMQRWLIHDALYRTATMWGT